MWIIMMIEPFSRKLLATAFIACRENKSHFSLTVTDVTFHLHFRTLLHFFIALAIYSKVMNNWAWVWYK